MIADLACRRCCIWIRRYSQSNHSTIDSRRELFSKSQQKSAVAKTMGCSHFPPYVMAFASPENAVDPDQRKLEINAATVYQQVLRDVLEPWSTRRFSGDGFTVQQN
ncbi:hypothetical protein KIN20_031494 [Parelaphostrongylus tenuis]|uniref:Uncharacterized protein n=1 Tax=Parelaphostrongylus tenuis TaxID=148309 RepID=A0AAD5WGU9_PARTN|nr:hypothetical protein KIN20_031494 [Parelaphostrongylus tenuis]